ncbi:MAG: hypothetical protein KC502_21020 [Myxococcales bacterium]|nr:hypothetical protein [Myxococcales bacterium]
MIAVRHHRVRNLLLAAMCACLLSTTAFAKGPKKRVRSTKSAASQKAGKKAAKPNLKRSWLTAEDLRLGDFRVPPSPYPFPLLGDDKARDVFVDKAGRLYKERKYSGVIPDWKMRRSLRRGRCRVREQTLTWVGFQNTFNSSRIFVKVDGEACGYVYRPDEKHIVIDLPAVRITNPNLKRDILTGAFPTPVALVHIESIGSRGTRVTIALKQPQRYLSAHVGKFVFVDVAR